MGTQACVCVNGNKATSSTGVSHRVTFERWNGSQFRRVLVGTKNCRFKMVLDGKGGK